MWCCSGKVTRGNPFTFCRNLRCDSLSSISCCTMRALNVATRSCAGTIDHQRSRGCNDETGNGGLCAPTGQRMGNVCGDHLSLGFVERWEGRFILLLFFPHLPLQPMHQSYHNRSHALILPRTECERARHTSWTHIIHHRHTSWHTSWSHIMVTLLTFYELGRRGGMQ